MLSGQSARRLLTISISLLCCIGRLPSPKLSDRQVQLLLAERLAFRAELLAEAWLLSRRKVRLSVVPLATLQLPQAAAQPVQDCAVPAS